MIRRKKINQGEKRKRLSHRVGGSKIVKKSHEYFKAPSSEYPLWNIY